MLNPERRSPARLEARCHATIASTDSVRLLGVAGQLRKKGAVRCKRRLAQRNPVPWTSQVWFPILISILTVAVVLLTRHRGRMTSFLSIKSAPDSVELVQREV